MKNVFVGVMTIGLLIGSGFTYATRTDADSPSVETHLYGFAKSDTRFGRVGGASHDGVFHPTFGNNYALGMEGYEEGSCPPLLVQVRQGEDVNVPVNFDIVFPYVTDGDNVIEDLEMLRFAVKPPALPRDFEEIIETNQSLVELEKIPYERNRFQDVIVTGPFKSHKGTVPATGNETVAHYNVSIPAMGQGVAHLAFCPRLTEMAAKQETNAYFEVYIKQTNEDVRFFRKQIIDEPQELD